VLFCASHVMSGDCRLLVLCYIWEEKRMVVKAGRRDINTRVPAIAWFELFCWLTNTKQTSLCLAQAAGT
jgi:hypothetical protein